MKAFLCLLGLLALAAAYNNGYGLKPSLGWNTWCAVGECGLDWCDEQQLRETADAMVKSGLKDAGYEWILLDDCWHPTRSLSGELVPKTRDFPNGMKVVADYVHSKGLKFGLYTSVGTLTCRDDPGSFGYWKKDADTFASWGIDMVKVDWCGWFCYEDGHKALSKALNETGRPIWLELCRGTYAKQDKWGYAYSISQSWRSAGDHHDRFEDTIEQVASVEGRSSWSGPYGWAYLDMMMTGGQGCKGQDIKQALHCPQQTNNQYRTEFSLYAIVASPLMIGTDIRNMTAIMNEVLLNTEVIAVNQDYLAKPGDVVKSCGEKAYARYLSNGNVAVAIPNLSTAARTMPVCFQDVGWKDTQAHVRDLWKHQDMGRFTNSFNATVEPYDTLFVILSP